MNTRKIWEKSSKVLLKYWAGKKIYTPYIEKLDNFFNRNLYDLQTGGSLKRLYFSPKRKERFHNRAVAFSNRIRRLWCPMFQRESGLAFKPPRLVALCTLTPLRDSFLALLHIFLALSFSSSLPISPSCSLFSFFFLFISTKLCFGINYIAKSALFLP